MTTVNPNGTTQRTISTTTTLTASDYGNLIICTGSSAYTVTLPAASSPRMIQFSFQTSSNALITLAPASGTIAGQSTVVYGSNEGCTIESDGSNWYIVQHYLQPVSFSVYLAGAQTITTSAAQIINFDTKNFDIGSFFSTSNHNYIPLYTGKYVFYYCLEWQAASTQNLVPGIYLNGSLKFAHVQGLNSGFLDTAKGSGILQLNGSTDTVDIRANTNGTNNALTVGSTSVYLFGHRISNF